MIIQTFRTAQYDDVGKLAPLRFASLEENVHQCFIFLYFLSFIVWPSCYVLIFICLFNSISLAVPLYVESFLLLFAGLASKRQQSR